MAANPRLYLKKLSFFDTAFPLKIVFISFYAFNYECLKVYALSIIFVTSTDISVFVMDYTFSTCRNGKFLQTLALISNANKQQYT